MCKQTLGMPAKAYLQQRRMHEACHQLRYTTLTVSEIAEWMGYASATYFVRSFSKIVGKTPNEYRKEVVAKSPEK